MSILINCITIYKFLQKFKTLLPHWNFEFSPEVNLVDSVKDYGLIVAVLSLCSWMILSSFWNFPHTASLSCVYTSFWVLSFSNHYIAFQNAFQKGQSFTFLPLASHCFSMHPSKKINSSVKAAKLFSIFSNQIFFDNWYGLFRYIFKNVSWITKSYFPSIWEIWSLLIFNAVFVFFKSNISFVSFMSERRFSSHGIPFFPILNVSHHFSAMLQSQSISLFLLLTCSLTLPPSRSLSLSLTLSLSLSHSLSLGRLLHR